MVANERKRREELTTFERYKYDVNLLWQDYLSNTTMHGLNCVVAATTSMESLTWLCLIFTSMCIAFIQLMPIVKQYTSFPVNTAIDLGSNTQEFPSVTICNVNAIKQSALNQATSIQELLASFKTEPSERSPLQRQADEERLFGGYLSTLSVDTRKTIGHKFEELVLDCTFDGEPCGRADFEETHSDQFGACFTFHHAMRTRDSSVTALPKFFAHKEGTGHGLVLTLFLDTDEYLEEFTQGEGLIIDVHAFNTIPSYKRGFSVPPNFESSLAFVSDKVYRLSPPHGNCTDGRNFKRLYGVAYTQDGCSMACRLNSTMNDCGCYEHSLTWLLQRLATRSSYAAKALLEMPPCGESHLTCRNRVVQFSDAGALHCPSCRTPCIETRYEVSHSMSEWPRRGGGTRFLKHIRTKLPPKLRARYSDPDKLRGNLLRLRLLFSTLSYDVVKQVPVYQLANFVADLGGVLGLWLGMSLLTMLEFGHVILTTVCLTLALPCLVLSGVLRRQD